MTIPKEKSVKTLTFEESIALIDEKEKLIIQPLEHNSKKILATRISHDEIFTLEDGSNGGSPLDFLQCFRQKQPKHW